MSLDEADDTTIIREAIKGPAGQLELRVDEPSEGVHEAWAIVCHPHPLYGGTMNNKVVTTLSRTFQSLGLLTVRFNFRGVGGSHGAYDEGRGEVDDLLAVMAWVKQESGQQDVWLGGFSFGAYIAAKAATMTEVKKLVTVAPPIENFPMQSLPPILCDWILVQGERDEVVNPQKVFAWAENLNPPPTILRFKEAGHFFHGQLIELRTRLAHALMGDSY